MKSSSTFPDARIKRLAACLTLALVLGGAGPASARQTPDLRVPSSYLRDQWGRERGFPGGVVSAIAQSVDGYLWIGTEYGLVRFDGLRFDSIPNATPKGQPITRVLGLSTDADGTLWVRLQGARLVRYRNGVFEEVTSPMVQAEAGFTAMSRVHSGPMLLVGLRSGLVRAHHARFDTLVTEANMPDSLIISVAEGPAGSVWVGTRDIGLYSLDADEGGQLRPVHAPLRDRKVNCLLPVGDRDLWIGTDTGIARWDGESLTDVAATSEAGARQVLEMVRDRRGNVWAGTSRGLLRIDPHGAVTLDDRDERPGRAVTALFEDREGNIWVGRPHGIERLRTTAFVSYTQAPDAKDTEGGALFVDPTEKSDRIWFAPASGGLYAIRGSQRRPVAAVDGDVIYSLAGQIGDLWMGRQRGGIVRLAGSIDRPRTSAYLNSGGPDRAGIFAMHRSRDGAIWAATLSAGVHRVSAGHTETFTTANGLPSNTVTAIEDGPGDTVWFGTPAGIAVRSKDAWRTISEKDGLPFPDVITLLRGEKDVMWLGTAAGLAIATPERILVPSGSSLLGAPVHGLAEDRTGGLWIATSHRILRVPRDKLLQGAVSESDAREYGLSDGLLSTETIKRHRSVVSDNDGRIWFATHGGLSMTDPSRGALDAAPAIVHLQEVSADGASFDPRTPVHLASPRQRVTFSYAGLSLSVPERVRFKFKLDGFDETWSDPTAAREAVYTNLNPREYVFRVMASNSDGLWNGQEAFVALTIDPVFWQTWWFRISVLSFVVLSAVTVYRLRIHSMTRRLSLRFEERLAERTRIAQELHDTLLQGFLSASMQLHVATEQLPQDSPARGPLARVLALMGQVIDEGRKAVRGLRATPGNDLDQAFANVRDEIGSVTAASFRVIVEGQPRALKPIIRDEMYRIGREALVNAFRHADASTIEMHLEYAAHHIRMLVRDDGVGIEPDVVRSGTDGHWGLPGMRERAERIGARLKVFSRTGAGTEVELIVPGHVAWETPGGRDREPGQSGVER